MTVIHRLFSAMLTACILLSCSLPFNAVGEPMPQFGDIDQNGSLSAADVRSVLLYTVGRRALMPSQRAAADYNEDFAADTSDARSILIAFLTNALPKPLPHLSANDQAQLLAAVHTDTPTVVLNNGQPLFTDTQKQRRATYEEYALTDSSGRCGAAYANLCRELMPTEERESLSSVTPTGWHNRSYDCVPGGWLYNRSHLIGFQLAGEQANRRNLITGTQYLNIRGMLPIENVIADYITQTGHHVLYRVTPYFIGDNLLCEGIEIEAWSVEDNGKGICIHVYCYNVQPGVVLDRATGENRIDDGPHQEEVSFYVLNLVSRKFHLPTCASAAAIAVQNRGEHFGPRDELIDIGYTPCGNCDP